MTGIPWSTLGPTGLLALTVLLVIRGDLIPRKQYDAMVADRDFWRDLAGKKDEVIAEFVEPVKTASKALDELPKVPSQTSGVASTSKGEEAGTS